MNELDPVELLVDLIQHYSPSKAEDTAVKYFLKALKMMGFETQTDPAGNAIGSKGSGSKEIMLLGHIDTVPGQIEIKRHGNVLYGRGTVDAKGPLACFAASAALVDPPSDWKLTIVGAVGEESDSRGAHYLCETHPAPEMVIIGEPSGWDRLTIGYKGSAWVSYNLDKPLEHSAAQGDSVCDEAFSFAKRLHSATDKYNDNHSGIFNHISPTIKEMKSSHNGFKASAQLEINIRIPTAFDRDSFSSFLQSLTPPETFDIMDFLPAFRANKNSPLVKALLPAIRNAGGTPSFSVKSGTCDMNVVGPTWACPILAYGPGDSSLDHTPNEHINLEEYLRAIRVLSQALNILTTSNKDKKPVQQSGESRL